MKSSTMFRCGLALIALSGLRGGCLRANASESTADGTRTDRVLVRFQPGVVSSVLLATLGSTLLDDVPGTDYHAISVPTGSTATGFVTTLATNLSIAAVQLDLGIDAPEGEGSTIPAGGSLLASQIPTQGELLRIGLAAASSRATGAGVRVAVVDTGILATLDGVAGSVDTNGYDMIDHDSDPTDATNGLDDDGDGYVDELYAHGTFVASLIVAVAPDVRILPIRALDADGRGTSSGVAAAITYAVQHDAQVINLSLRISPNDGVVGTAIGNARSHGIEVVAAAGNTGVEDATLPSVMSNALLVAAVGSDDVVADFSATGSAVDLAAPGVDLSGAYPESPGTAIWSGTSFATALVTGGFALVRERHPSWTIDAVSSHLKTTSAGLHDANPSLDGKLGAGRLDLDAATAP